MNFPKFILPLLILVALAGGCKKKTDLNKPMREINIVKEAHTGELMALPGVTGVYVGEMPDHTPCIVVMVVYKTRDIENRIPKTLEGHPVRIDESGVIKPMK